MKKLFSTVFMVLGLSHGVFAEEWESSVRIKVKGGLVKDTVTGLIWMRCSLGQNWDGQTCVGEAEKYKWQKAMNTSKYFEYAGYSGWRLPTIDELQSLVYCSHGYKNNYCSDNSEKPNIRHEFPNTPSDSFWSSSPFADNHGGNGWYTYFIGGYALSFYGSDKTSHYVRLVRG